MPLLAGVQRRSTGAGFCWRMPVLILSYLRSAGHCKAITGECRHLPEYAIVCRINVDINRSFMPEWMVMPDNASGYRRELHFVTKRFHVPVKPELGRKIPYVTTEIVTKRAARQISTLSLRQLISIQCLDLPWIYSDVEASPRQC